MSLSDESLAHSSNSPEQELAFIRAIISDSRRSMVEDGKPYIVWGLVVAIAMLVTYVSALFAEDFYTAWLWIAMVFVGLGYTIYETRSGKKRAASVVRSFADRLQGAIWGACGTALGLSILLIMFGYSATSPSIPPIFTCSIAALILGIAYWLSGFVLELPWLRNIGIVWWLGAIGMYFLHSVHVLGIYAGMMLLFQVVPGIILNRRYRAQSNGGSRTTAVAA